MKYLCPKCKGIKEVFNPEVLFLTVMVPFVMFLESLDDSPGKMSKKECPNCKGKGYLVLK